MLNVTGAINHIRSDQKYPANKAQLVAECDNLSDFSEEDKKEFTQKLPDRTYNGADEVISALGLQQ